MRLLFVSHSFPPLGRPQANLGGMQRVAMDLGGALRDTPDLTVHEHILRSSATWAGIRTTGFLLYSLWQLPRIVRRKRIDVILFSSMVTASLAVPLRRRLAALHCTTVAIAHGLDVVLPAEIYQWWVRRVLRALDAVAPVSRATASACTERGMDPSRVHVIPNGISADRFRLVRLDEDRQPKEEPGPTGTGSESLALLSVGRHVKRKGFDWFVDAVMPQLPEGVTYWIVGEGPATEDIRAAVKRHRLEGRVHLPGRVDGRRLERLYAGADLFIMPNIPLAGDMEGFGVVLLEAGLMGVPCLAADLEGIRDVVTDGVNGRLLPATDAEAWTGQIRSLLEERLALDEMAARTRPYVLERFAWRAIATRFVELFRKLERRPA